MAKRFLVTVGTSLVDNLNRDETTAFREIRQVLDNRLAVTADYLLAEDLPREMVGRPTNNADRANIGAHWFLHRYSRRGIEELHSAEVKTLARLQPAPDDEILLLCSDTPLGAFCAVITALLLTSEKGGADSVQVISSALRSGYEESALGSWAWPPADYTMRLHEDLRPLQREQVWIRRVPGLDPHRQDVFEQEAAANLIGMVAQGVNDARRKGLEAEIVFTGGYKAAVPLLTVAAGWLGGVPLSALYQESEDIQRLPAMEMRPSQAAREYILGFDAPEDSRFRHYPNLAQGNESLGAVLEQVRPFFVERKDGEGLALSLLGAILRSVLLQAEASRTEAGQ